MKSQFTLAVLLLLSSLPLIGLAQAPAKTAATVKGVDSTQNVRRSARPPGLLDQHHADAPATTRKSREQGDSSHRTKPKLTKSKSLRRTTRIVVTGPSRRTSAARYNDFWWDRGTKVVKTLRTSLIIDPRTDAYPHWHPALPSNALREHNKRFWAAQWMVPSLALSRNDAFCGQQRVRP
jgi:hypothetical protein